MDIHALQTGTVAVRSRQREGRGAGPLRLVTTMLDREWTDPLPILAWLIEHPEGLILVDTGETSQVSEPGYFPGWHPYFRFGLREWVGPEEEIGERVRALGYSPADVRWVVLTHLHTDHAGGLDTFPASEILVSRTELEQASGLAGRLSGYLNNRWPEWFDPTAVDFDARPLGPFERSFTLTRSEDVHLVPVPGHTRGQLAVIVEEHSHSIFLAGDTSYTEEHMTATVADGVTPDPATAEETLRRVQEYALSTPTVYLPSHDPAAPMRLAGRRTVGGPLPLRAIAA
jgi:glyoxylase-like metal-dependent hydrolase (beta-lactamase superfamily II)